MKEITITVKPSLADISDPSRLSDIVGEIEKIVQRNLDLCAEDIAETVLEFAQENASQGYRNVPYSGNRTVSWENRDPITDLLYEISPYHESHLPGLTTGANKLIDSLERHGADNIFENVGRTVRVGSRFKHASLLEKGGHRPAGGNIGFNAEGRPNRWLSKAIRQGRISAEEVARIRGALSVPRFIEPRPFLYPAMWHVRDSGIHTGICSATIIRELRTDLRLDKIRSIRGESEIVTR